MGLVSVGSRLEREVSSVVARADAPYSVNTTWGISGGVSVLVARAPQGSGVLMCGDAVLTPQRPPACSTARPGPGLIRFGDWFADPVSGLEVVCTRPGDGVLTFAGRLMRSQPTSSRWQRRRADRRGGGRA